MDDIHKPSVTEVQETLYTLIGDNYRKSNKLKDHTGDILTLLYEFVGEYHKEFTDYINN